MKLPARLDLSTVPAVLAQASSLPARLDLSSVQSADSCGIALLLELTRRQRGLELSGASPQLRSLASFFGVDSLLKFV